MKRKNKGKKKYYVKGKSDVFAVVIALKYLLTQEEFHLLIDGINMQINQLRSNTKQITARQIESQMGFPEKWKEIDALNLEILYQ